MSRIDGCKALEWVIRGEQRAWGVRAPWRELVLVGLLTFPGVGRGQVIISNDLVVVSNLTQTAASGTNYLLGELGLGTTMPDQRLTLGDDGGIVAVGQLGSGRSLSTSGAGTRLVWYPRKGAFRAGTLIPGAYDYDCWDEGNIGTNSIAMGYRSMASGFCATVGGGEWNWADYAYATAAGGENNWAGGDHATVSGGRENWALSSHATIIGGAHNEVAGLYGTVLGGYQNDAGGSSSLVLGGAYNSAAGSGSYAAGRYAHADHNGTFVWQSYGSAAGVFASTDTNQFLIQAPGGVGIGTNAPEAMLDVAGTARFRSGIDYIPPLGNLSMGIFTNGPAQ